MNRPTRSFGRGSPDAEAALEAQRAGARADAQRVQHSLRTALNLVIGYAELILEMQAMEVPGSRLEPVRDLRRAGVMMLAAVNSAFAPWRVQADGLELETLHGDLAGPLEALELAFDLAEAQAPRESSSRTDLDKIRRALRDLRAELEQARASFGSSLRAFRQAEGAGRGRSLAPSARAEGSRVLVVDDDPFNRELIERRLSMLGYEVSLAQDGREALTAMERTDYDLVLLDVLMPRLDGFATLDVIKSNPSWRDVPVVMLTALDDPESIARCISAGAEDYVPKPFNPVVLRARIEASLEKKRLRDREHCYLERIREEQEKSERLLLNVLPTSIASRLKQGEESIVDQIEAATVLFADIVEFTAFARGAPPATTVGLLNEIFHRFDQRVEECGLEKIKTIGDAYLAVAGVPEPAPDHASRAARMALALLEEMRAFNAQHGFAWCLRIGLHSGPVMAGVIGSKKFAYDLWGDTVNLASRLESQGAPDRIHVSAATAALLEGAFRLEPVGELDLRHRGQVMVHRLIGPAQA